MSSSQLPASNSLYQQAKFSLTKIRLPWLLFTLAVFFSLIKLGLWQNDRAIEKEQRLSRIAELNQQQSISLSQVMALKNQSANNTNDYINDIPVFLAGEFVPDVLFLLDNQVNKSGLGYRVLQVFRSENQAVLVNLGWVLGSIDRAVLPDITAISGQFKVQGHVRVPEAGIMLAEQLLTEKNWPLRIQQIELDKFSTLLGYKLLPFVVYLDKTESLGYVKNWQPIVMPPEKHRGYAFQWFSLATAWLMLMAWASGLFSRLQTNKNNNKD